MGQPQWQCSYQALSTHLVCRQTDGFDDLQNLGIPVERPPSGLALFRFAGRLIELTNGVLALIAADCTELIEDAPFAASVCFMVALANLSIVSLFFGQCYGSNLLLRRLLLI